MAPWYPPAAPRLQTWPSTAGAPRAARLRSRSAAPASRLTSRPAASGGGACAAEASWVARAVGCCLPGAAGKRRLQLRAPVHGWYAFKPLLTVTRLALCMRHKPPPTPTATTVQHPTPAAPAAWPPAPLPSPGTPLSPSGPSPLSPGAACCLASSPYPSGPRAGSWPSRQSGGSSFGERGGARVPSERRRWAAAGGQYLLDSTAGPAQVEPELLPLPSLVNPTARERRAGSSRSSETFPTLLGAAATRPATRGHRERLVINLKSWKVEQQLAFLRKGGAEWSEEGGQAKEVSGERLAASPLCKPSQVKSSQERCTGAGRSAVCLLPGEQRANFIRPAASCLLVPWVPQRAPRRSPRVAMFSGCRVERLEGASLPCALQGAPPTCGGPTSRYRWW